MYKILLVIITVSIWCSLPLQIRADSAGVINHDTQLRLGANDTILEYTLVMFYVDFESLYLRLDTNSNRQIELTESENWLASSANKFTIRSGGKVFQPYRVDSWTDYSSIKDDAYPEFKFQLYFPALDLDPEFRDFSFQNTYRVQEDSLENWLTSFDQETVEVQQVEVIGETEVKGQWKKVVVPSPVYPNLSSTTIQQLVYIALALLIISIIRVVWNLVLTFKKNN